MLKRLITALALASSFALTAAASPLHSSDPEYRGAFTLLAVANLSGASAKYSTQVVITNLSDHTVTIRLELYSLSGYREGVMVNTLAPAIGTGQGSFWGGSQPNWEFTKALGESGMGALRVVAVKGDGSEDPTAVLHGYGRLWIEPYAGGRVAEYIPALTDYEASGGLRRSRLHFADRDTASFIIDPKPFARDRKDTTYGGSRVNVGFVNFDRDHEATFTIGARDGEDYWGDTYHMDPIVVVVPAGSVRQVPLPLAYTVGPGAPPIFPYDTPLLTQVFNVGHQGASDDWSTFATLIDGTTSSSTFFFDSNTDGR